MNSKKRTAIRRALLKWFYQHARELPWRNTDDPYPIWLSEIMLQQTQVKTVIPYYEAFLAAFPDVHALARADDNVLLKVWEGLGYYRRVHHLKKAAQIISNDHKGEFPTTFDAWSKLPGIGDYTAGAIVSIAFKQRCPAVDGNAKRVLARITGERESIDNNAVKSRLTKIATDLLPQKEPGMFNQAIMELGAGVCTPRQPQCQRCPVQKHCDAFQTNRQHVLPVRKARKAVPHVDVVAAAIRKNGRYLLGRRPSGGMLEGLWEFPGGKVEKDETKEDALRRELREELGVEVQIGELITSVDHVYSHLAVTIHLYLCHPPAEKPRALYHSDLKWVPRSHLRRYAFPAANLKFLEWL